MADIAAGHSGWSAQGRLVALGAAALLACVAYLTIGLRGNIAFVLELRAMRLAAMIEVGVAVALSTAVFQTVTANRILTPSIMGFDALYVFGQAGLVFMLTGLGFASLDPRLVFIGNSLVMMAFALVLFLPMLGRTADLALLLLAGIVIGMLLRSMTSLLLRLIDPNDFAVLQNAMFAGFNTARADLVAVGAGAILLCAAVVWRLRHALDVMALGRDSAVGLGVDWRRLATLLLLLVALLVAVSTALVGPIIFLGLLVVSLAERLVGTRMHAVFLPACAFVAIIVLVGGQTVLQHGLGGEATLSVVIEFVGGILFLALLFWGSRR